MAITQSPLSTAANNIVRLGNRNEKTLPKIQREFQDFSRFLNLEVIKLQKQELPDKRKIKNLSNINIANNFGSIGSLLSNLLGGALDLGGFIRGMFPGKGEKVGKAPSPTKAQPKPTVSGGKLKLGGMKALGIANAVFAGLDFATGLAEGESVGKAASGAVGSFGGALAGSLLAGAIGQTLIPIPGVGFILGMAGGAAGGFLGGYGADRAYEAVTGETKQKQEQQLKAQEEKQKREAKTTTVEALSFSEVLLKFEEAVVKFEDFSMNIGNLMGIGKENIYGYSEELPEGEAPTPPEDIDSGPINYGTGNAEFGDTGNVSNAKGWVHGHFQGTSPQSVTRDTVMVVKSLLQQGSPVYLNQSGGGGIDLSPRKKYTDEEIYNYVESARKAHTHSGTGKSIDVFVRKGTKVPVPLVNIGPSGKGYSGWGRGGNSGYIQGTTTWIGHLTPNSKPGLAQTAGQARGKMSPEVNVENSTLQQTPTQTPTPQQTKPQTSSTSQISSLQQSSQRPITQALPQNVMVSPPKPERQIQTYPSYSQGQSYIIDRETIITMGAGGNSRSRPQIIPVGGGGSQTIVISPEAGSVLLNSLMKNILLTSLSST